MPAAREAHAAPAGGRWARRAAAVNKRADLRAVDANTEAGLMACETPAMPTPNARGGRRGVRVSWGDAGCACPSCARARRDDASGAYPL
jgi:hypothetical protein